MAGFGSLAPEMTVDPATGVPLENSPAAQGKFGRISDAVLAGLRNWIETPGRAMQDGITTDQAVDWAAPTAMGMVGAPGVPAGALGSAARNPLYHGSPRTNLQFLNPSERGPLGPGLYTSEAPQIAKSYAGDAGRVYEMPNVERDIYRGHGHRTDEEWFGFKQDRDRLLAAAEPEKQPELAAILEKTWSNDGYPAYQRIRQLYGGHEGAQGLFKKAGFEGVSGLVDGPETVLFGQQSHPISPADGSFGSLIPKSQP